MKRVGSKLRRITLGRYPDLSLAEARAQARTMLADIRDMEKPVARRSPPSRTVRGLRAVSAWIERVASMDRG